jgi:hypothetical protein
MRVIKISTGSRPLPARSLSSRLCGLTSSVASLLLRKARGGFFHLLDSISVRGREIRSRSSADSLRIGQDETGRTFTAPEC